jgi:hypothetical protein
MHSRPPIRTVLIIGSLAFTSLAAPAASAKEIKIRNCTSETIRIMIQPIENEDSATPNRQYPSSHHDVRSQKAVTEDVPTDRVTVQAEQGVIAPKTEWTSVEARDDGIYFKGFPNRFGHYHGHELKPLNKNECKVVP